jgi:hypothetical protein
MKTWEGGKMKNYVFLKNMGGRVKCDFHVTYSMMGDRGRIHSLSLNKGWCSI